jgi:phosphatidate cytidylyltransferase
MLGPILILALIGLIWLDDATDPIATPEWLHALWGRAAFPRGTLLFVVFVPIAFQAARELAKILRDKQITASTRITVGAALAGLAVSVFVPSSEQAITSVAISSSAAAIVLLASLAFYSRNKTVEGVVAACGGALLAFVWLGLMGGFLLAVRREHSAWMLLWILAVTKSCDIGAYFTGRKIGKRQLVHWISPGKTWEGLIGGAVVSACVGALGAFLLVWSGNEVGPYWSNGALAGAIFGVIGQTGDLIASIFKRDAGIKDAGRILPGFGGVLDLVDSPLLVAPVAYWWLSLFVPPMG